MIIKLVVELTPQEKFAIALKRSEKVRLENKIKGLRLKNFLLRERLKRQRINLIA